MSRRNIWVYSLFTLAFIVYGGWMIGPYLVSIIVRDAAVTGWLYAAVSPIDGTIVSDLPHVGSRIGQDGRVARVRNTLLIHEARSVEQTRDRVVVAGLKLTEAEMYLTELEELERVRLANRRRNIESFLVHQNVDIATSETEITVNAERIEVLERLVARWQALVDKGSGSEASLNDALFGLADMKVRQTEARAALGFARQRKATANNGVYISRDGGTPNWVWEGEIELRLEIRRALREINLAESELTDAENDFSVESKTFKNLSDVIVRAPFDSVVMRVVAVPSDTVSAGDRIIEWIDCSELMVDVPVSDAELPLILRGAPAEVVLEGEPRARRATVLLTRGSSATIGSDNLAAVAKGRTEGVAQVLMTLDANESDFEQCPVGRAAYVEFPDVGLIDVLRARLRI